MHLLFERAMLWGMIDVDRNIIELVHLLGGSRRLRRPLVLTPEQYQDLTWRLEEPHRTMVTVAMYTGLRASEILALRWEDINFESGVVPVQRGVVNGRKVRSRLRHPLTTSLWPKSSRRFFWTGNRKHRKRMRG